MKKLSLFLQGMLSATGVLTYIFLVASFMNNANDWFGVDDQGIVAPMAVIMLFLFSALVTGGLVLGRPILLYLDGQKKNGIKLLLFTGAGLFVMLILIFSLLLFLNKVNF